MSYDYEKRATDPQANLDTLIKIARKEYSPSVNTIEFINDLLPKLRELIKVDLKWINP